MLSVDTLMRRLPSAMWVTGILVLMGLATLGVRSWLASRDAVTKLTATLAAQKQILDRATSDEQQHDAELTQTLANISAAKQQVQTPAEAMAHLPEVLPPLPQPVTLAIAPPTVAEPAPAAQASIPQADLKPLYDYVQDCRACNAKLATAQSDLTDEQAKVAALTTERDAANKALKGGSIWLRLKP